MGFWKFLVRNRWKITMRAKNLYFGYNPSRVTRIEGSVADSKYSTNCSRWSMRFQYLAVNKYEIGTPTPVNKSFRLLSLKSAFLLMRRPINNFQLTPREIFLMPKINWILKLKKRKEAKYLKSHIRSHHLYKYWWISCRSSVILLQLPYTLHLF